MLRKILKVVLIVTWPIWCIPAALGFVVSVVVMDLWDSLDDLIDIFTKR